MTPPDPTKAALEARDGIVYVLPRGESKRLWAMRVGPLAFGITCRFTGFGIGFDLLKHGGLIQLGPIYIFGAHVENYLNTELDSRGREG